MSKQKDSYLISLKLILKNEKGEILALKDASTSAFKGYYDLPGGSIDVSEYSTDLKDILMREVREETGNLKIRLLSDAPVAVGRHETENHTRIFYVFYEGEYEGGEVVISDEHEAFLWLDLKKIHIDTYFISGMADGIRMYLHL